MAGFRSDTRTLMLWVARLGIELPGKEALALEVGRAMTEARLGVVGGTAPYTWALAGPVKLPAGLALDAAAGTIGGTPQAAGSYALVVHVKDAKGAVGIARMAIEVRKSGRGG